MDAAIPDRLNDLKRLARRGTIEEQIACGYAALESIGLDQEQVEELAQDMGLDAECLALSVAMLPPHQGEESHPSPAPDEILSAIDDKIEEIRRLVLEQRDSSLRKDWYSVGEVARLTGYQPYTIRQCCNTGRIVDDWKVKDLRTGKWRISKDAVLWIQNHGLPPAT